MDDYWQWRKGVLAQFGRINKALDSLAQATALFEKAATQLSVAGRASVDPTRTATWWLGLREAQSKMRLGERKLTLLGYDTEIALSKAYFLTLVRKTGIQDQLTQKLKQSSDFTYDLHWYFEDDVPCNNSVKLAPDRIGIVIHVSAPLREYDVATECAFHYASNGVQFFPTRGAEVCASGQASWPEQVELRTGVEKFLWAPENWAAHPVALPQTPLGNFAPYMESVGANVSIFSKGRIGRHPTLVPLGAVPADFDLAVSGSAQAVTTAVLQGIDGLNASPAFNVAWHHTSAKLEGGPFFNPPSVDFVVGVYHKDEGGADAGEWHLDLSGKALIRASFVRTDNVSGSFQMSQVGYLYDYSGSFSNKVFTVGLDSDKLPDFAKGLLNNFIKIQLSGFSSIPVSIPTATYMDSQVQSDRVVFFVRMS